VRAAQRVFDARTRFFGQLAADGGFMPAPRPVSPIWMTLCALEAQGLGIGIGGDEFNAVDTPLLIMC
jgi:hypothetical protein